MDRASGRLSLIYGNGLPPAYVSCSNMLTDEELERFRGFLDEKDREYRQKKKEVEKLNKVLRRGVVALNQSFFDEGLHLQYNPPLEQGKVYRISEPNLEADGFTVGLILSYSRRGLTKRDLDGFPLSATPPIHSRYLIGPQEGHEKTKEFLYDDSKQIS